MFFFNRLTFYVPFNVRTILQILKNFDTKILPLEAAQNLSNVLTS